MTRYVMTFVFVFKVSPANFVVDLCKSSQGKILMCDPNPSNASVADVMICGPAGEMLPKLVKCCKELLRK